MSSFIVLRAALSPVRVGAACLLLLLVALPAAAQTSDSATDSPSSASDTEAAAADASAADETSESTSRGSKLTYGPKDGKYLVDEDGREYWVEVISKGNEGSNYRWVDDKHVRLYGGLTFEVLDEDEETFSLKFLKPTRQPKTNLGRRSRVATEEQIEAAARTYESDVETVDRLRLESWDTGMPRRGQWRHGFDVADMNGDGHLDIVHGPSRKGRPTPNIFLGDGEGNWTFWSQASYPRFPFDYGDVAVADFDGDGNQDLVVGMHLKGLMVLRGDGKGKFERWSKGIDVEIPGQGGDASTFSSREVEIADWNRDGRPDILAFGEGPKATSRMALDRGKIETKSSRGVVIFLNGGDEGWKPLEMDGQKIFGDSLAVARLNDDDRLDFVTSSSIVGYPHILHYGTSSGGWETREFEALRPRAYVRAVETLSVDDDDLDDLVVGYVNNHMRVWRTGVDLYRTGGEQDPTKWTRTTLGAIEGRSGIYAVDSGDLDGDGHPDVVATTGEGELWVFLGGADGTMVREETPEAAPRAVQCRGYGLRLHDLDGDGRDEIIVGFAGESSVAPNATRIEGCDGDGSFEIFRVVDAAASGEPTPAR